MVRYSRLLSSINSVFIPPRMCLNLLVVDIVEVEGVEWWTGQIGCTFLANALHLTVSMSLCLCWVTLIYVVVEPVVCVWEVIAEYGEIFGDRNRILVLGCMVRACRCPSGLT